MTFFVVAFLLLLLAIIVVFVFTPLFQRESFRSADESLSIDEQIGLERRAIYRAIRELDLDFGTGKLVESDYRHQRSLLERRALALLREEDAETAALEAQIEREVAALRAASRDRSQPAAVPSNGSEPAPAASNGEKAVTSCPRCHQSSRSGDRFCSHCGHSLAEGALT